MYASTHSDAAQTAVKYGITQQEAASATDKAQSSVQQNAVDVADTAVHAEVPAGLSVQIAKPQDAGADNSAETGAAPVAEKLTGLSNAGTKASLFIAFTSALCVCCVAMFQMQSVLISMHDTLSAFSSIHCKQKHAMLKLFDLMRHVHSKKASSYEVGHGIKSTVLCANRYTCLCCSTSRYRAA